ncbi:MAG: tetratricopeptide repeat protein [Candidatus Schekmanbacteria bacterium]|nr:tetratricopeptide repeat protein [Candidatus Schekmanbacteria bacterium]
MRQSWPKLGVLVALLVAMASLVEAQVSVSPQARNNYDQGVAFEERRDLEHARQAYERAIEISPGFALPYAALGRMHANDGAHERAVEMFRKFIALDATVAAVHYNLGRSLLALQNLSEATSEFRQAVSQDPTFTEAREALGEVLAVQGDKEGAAEQFSQALEHNPSSVRANTVLGGIRMEQGRLDEALSYFRKVVELTPKQPVPRIRVADLLRMTGQDEEAAKAYRELIEVAPNLKQVAIENLGDLAFKAEDFGKAKDYFEDLRKLLPAYPDAAVKLARTEARLKRVEAAEKLYLEAIGLAAGLMDARLELADLYAAANRADDAEKTLLAALALAPETAAAHARLAALLQARGDRAGAAEAFEKAGAGAGADASLLAKAGSLYLEIGNLEKAAGIFAQLIAGDHVAVGVIVDSGVAEWLRGDRAKAVERFREAVELHPDDPIAQFSGAVALLATGKADAAAELLEKAKASLGKTAAFANNLGALSLLKGDVAAADQALQKAADMEPTNWQVSVNQAQAELHKGDGRGAFTRLEAILPKVEAPPEELLWTYAAAAAQAGRTDAASATLQTLRERLKARGTDLRELDKLLASVLLAQHKPREALALLDELIKAAPEPSPALLNNRAVALFALGQAAEAAAVLQSAAAKQPQDGDIQANLALAYGSTGDRAQALAALRSSLGAGGAQASAADYYRLGLAYYQNGLSKDAAEAFAQSLQREERQPRALGALAVVQYELGDQAAAQRSAERALALDAGELNSLLVLGICLDEQANDKARAVELYRRYVAAGGKRSTEVTAWIASLERVYGL